MFVKLYHRSQGIFAIGMVVSALIFSPVFAQDKAGLMVDASQDLGAINPYVYGANFGQSVIPPDVMPQALALGLKYLRLGGGFSDQRDLDKPTVDLYAAQAKQMGAELALTVRLLKSTPEKAADIVRYANIEKGYHVRYWSIGNEPNLFTDLMHVPYTTADLNREWRVMAEAMRAVDPDIILVGPDITQYVVLNVEPIQYLPLKLGGHALDNQGRDWLQEFLRANGDLVDIVSIHRYPYPGAGGSNVSSATIDGLRANSQEWDTIIPNLRKVIQNAAGRDIPIAVTEFNSNSTPSSGGEAGLDSLYNAVWFADVLGRLIRQQVQIAAYWNLRSRGDGFGLLGIFDVRPTYYVYSMYKQFGTQLLASSSDQPDVSIYAARRDDGALTLMVVNLASDAKSILLTLKDFTPKGAAQVWRLDADHKAEQIADEAITDGQTISVPGASVTLYSLPAQ